MVSGVIDLGSPLVTAWLGGTAALADVAPRTEDEHQRMARRADYLTLVERADAGVLITILRSYVRSTLPVTRALERTSWSVTGPAAHRSVTDSYRRLAAVAVGAEETLVLSESRLGGGDPEPGGFLLVDSQTLESQVGPVGDIQRDFGGSFARNWIPGSEERGIISLGFYDWGSFHTLMAAPRVVTAARALNLRLLAGGTSPHSADHVFDLADHLVAIMPGDRPLSAPLGSETTR
jgi:hypothetical protein